MSLSSYVIPQIWVLLASFIFLIYSCYTDIQMAKVKNHWILAGIGLLLISYYLCFNTLPTEGFLAAAAAFGLGFLAFHFGILGAADVKVWMVLALGLNIKLTLVMLALSFVFAAMMGVGISLLRGDLVRLFTNTFLVSLKYTKAERSLPMTLPILLAWLSTHCLYFSGFLADL